MYYIYEGYMIRQFQYDFFFKKLKIRPPTILIFNLTQQIPPHIKEIFNSK